VLTQFLIEATVLSVLGGLLGVAAAVVGSQFTIAGVTPVIVPGSVALALGICVPFGCSSAVTPPAGPHGCAHRGDSRYE
jgi:putative ABC transport system permease protein